VCEITRLPTARPCCERRREHQRKPRKLPHRDDAHTSTLVSAKVVSSNLCALMLPRRNSAVTLQRTA